MLVAGRSAAQQLVGLVRRCQRHNDASCLRFPPLLPAAVVVTTLAVLVLACRAVKTGRQRAALLRLSQPTP